MLTNKFPWSSFMFLGSSLGKELTNWESLLSKNLDHSFQLTSWVLMWCYTFAFITQIFCANFNGLMSGFNILLISLVLIVTLLIPQARVRSMVLLPEF